MVNNLNIQQTPSNALHLQEWCTTGDVTLLQIRVEQKGSSSQIDLSRETCQPFEGPIVSFLTL